MEAWQADLLASEISQSWTRSSIAQDIWRDEIAGLEVRQAQATLKVLRRTSERAPSIIEFHRCYRSLTAHDPTPTTCLLCAGTGWVTDDVRNHPHHWAPENFPVPGTLDNQTIGPEPTCNCNVVVRCRCTNRTSELRATA